MSVCCFWLRALPREASRLDISLSAPSASSFTGISHHVAVRFYAGARSLYSSKSGRPSATASGPAAHALPVQCDEPRNNELCSKDRRRIWPHDESTVGASRHNRKANVEQAEQEYQLKTREQAHVWPPAAPTKLSKLPRPWSAESRPSIPTAHKPGSQSSTAAATVGPSATTKFPNNESVSVCTSLSLPAIELRNSDLRPLGAA